MPTSKFDEHKSPQFFKLVIDKTSNLSVHQIWSRGGAPHRRSVVMVRPVFYAPAPTVYTEEKGRGAAAGGGLGVVVCNYWTDRFQNCRQDTGKE